MDRLAVDSLQGQCSRYSDVGACRYDKCAPIGAGQRQVVEYRGACQSQRTCGTVVGEDDGSGAGIEGSSVVPVTADTEQALAAVDGAGCANAHIAGVGDLTGADIEGPVHRECGASKTHGVARRDAHGVGKRDIDLCENLAMEGQQ